MFLVDTHVPIWIKQGIRMGPHALAALESAPANFISSISIVEWVAKSMLGRLTVPGGWDELTRAFEILEFSRSAALAVGDFPELIRHDPFDRMLLGQAKVSGMKFMTADRVLLGLGHDWIVDARS